MNLREKLAEAQYIHRGENGKYISDQCGFGCDHSYLVNLSLIHISEPTRPY